MHSDLPGPGARAIACLPGNFLYLPIAGKVRLTFPRVLADRDFSPSNYRFKH
jgi:hypothetical protein